MKVLLASRTTIFLSWAVALSELPTLARSADDFAHPNVTVTKIAFGSCHNAKYALKAAATAKQADVSKENVKTVWQTIAKEDASVWLWTGDAIYPPLKGIASVDMLRDEYHKMNTNRLLGYADYPPASSYVYGTWDDHDYGGNDLGKDMPDKQQRADAFYEFLNLPRPEEKKKNNNNNRQGVYSSVSFGGQTAAPNHQNQQVKIILLDTRWHREDHCVPSMATTIPFIGNAIACFTRWLSAGLVPNLCGGGGGSRASSSSPSHSHLLGDAQWEWLEQELRQSSAAIHVIVSSIQVLTTNPVRKNGLSSCGFGAVLPNSHSYILPSTASTLHSLQVMESWGHFPSERARLLRLLSRTPGAVILSGDVHYAEILSPSVHLETMEAATITSPLNSFFEVTSSGLTHTCKKAFYGGVCEPLLEIFHKHRSKAGKKDYYTRANYGTLEIDWEKRTMEVAIHDAQTGDVVLTTGPRSFEQQRKWTEQELEGVAACMDGHLIPVATAVATGGVVALLLLRFSGRARQAR